MSALYLRRFLRRVIIVNSGDPRAAWIPRSHNVLGFRAGISGEGILRLLEEQVDDVGVDRETGRFQVFRKGVRGFRLVSQGMEFTARKVVLATGMQDVQPLIDNLLRLRQEGLLRYCPVCDAYEYRDQKIAVLAQDEHGLKTSLFLTGFAKRLDVVWPGSQPVPRSLSGICKKKNVEIHKGDLVSIDERDRGRAGLTLSVRKKDGRLIRFDSYVCYVALGVVVQDFAFRHLNGLERSPDGFLIADTHQRLSIPGLYAVGDCVQGLAQISVASGQAAVAATAIHNELRAED